MKKTAEFVWDAALTYFDSAKNESFFQNISFDVSKKDSFIQSFCNEYENLKKDYMAKNVKHLDRHKQAALLIKCAIDNEILYVNNNELTPKEKRFVGLYKIALAMGLSYMKTRLNESLKNCGFEEIEDFTMPTAMTCDTSYFDILVRELYFQKNNDSQVYVLCISNILYLIEYITLQNKKIDVNDYTKKYKKLIKAQKAND